MEDPVAQGLAHHARGELALAGEWYRKAIAQTPGDLSAAELLADAEFALGRTQDAVLLLNRGASDSPVAALARRKAWWEQVAQCNALLTGDARDPVVLNRRGNALRELGQAREALQSYDEALALRPEYGAAHYNRGNALLMLQRPADAAESFARVLALDPTDAEAHVDHGNALADLGRHDDALQCYERAAALDPRSARAHYNRALLLVQTAHLEQAVMAFEQVLAADSGHLNALVRQGHALVALGRHAEAFARYERALASGPDDVELLLHAGNAQLTLLRRGDAIAMYDRALSIEPGYVPALINRGNALAQLGRHAEALASFDRAIGHAPASVEALYNRALLMRDLRRYEDAASSFERAMELSPGLPYVQGDLVNALQHCSRWERFAPLVAQIGRDVELGKRAAVPFALLAMSDSPERQLQCARTFAADFFPPQFPLWNGARYTHERIRIAYLSADFHDHATAHLMAELFERHDRARFEITAISFGPAAGGAMRNRLMRAFDRFVDVREMSDREIAGLVRSLEIDIGVDLKGYTQGCRGGILAHRPAPVQVNYLGYPGTMGAPYIDYIVADDTIIPPQLRSAYSEQVVCLPDCYQVNDRNRAIAQHVPSRAESGLPPSGFVFCCFNNNYKITPEIFEIWMRLLGKVEGSVLWLLDKYPLAANNLRREAAMRGVAPERLVFAAHAPLDTHLARHRLADLGLDTLPCNAHTTASDALWAGLPVLTCMGESFAGRVCASLLRAAGLPELVTHSLAEYEAMALALATSPPRLAILRERLSANLPTCALFDTPRFTRGLEAAYTTMWERQQRDEAPSPITLPGG